MSFCLRSWNQGTCGASVSPKCQHYSYFGLSPQWTGQAMPMLAQLAVPLCFLVGCQRRQSTWRPLSVSLRFSRELPTHSDVGNLSSHRDWCRSHTCRSYTWPESCQPLFSQSNPDSRLCSTVRGTGISRGNCPFHCWEYLIRLGGFAVAMFHFQARKTGEKLRPNQSIGGLFLAKKQAD